MIHSLTSEQGRTLLNGRMAFIWSGPEGVSLRYSVRTEETGQFYRLKQQNLKLIEAAPGYSIDSITLGLLTYSGGWSLERMHTRGYQPLEVKLQINFDSGAIKK